MAPTKFAINKHSYADAHSLVYPAYELYHGCPHQWDAFSDEERASCDMIPYGWRSHYRWMIKVLEKLDNTILSLYTMADRIRFDIEFSKDKDFELATRIQLVNFYGKLTSIDINSGKALEWYIVKRNKKIMASPPMNEYYFMVWQNIHHEKTTL